MGNQEARMWTTGAVWVGSILLAPVTGGTSLLVGGGIAAVRVGTEVSIPTRRAPVNRDRRLDAMRSKKVASLEVRYCHIASDKDGEVMGAAGDAGLTAAGRLFGMTTMAAHHHFVILTLESGELVYIDKHGERNILLVTDKRGKNGGGNAWLSSELLKSCKPTRWSGNVNLGNVIDHAERDEFQWYHLLDDNCQHFAEALYQWI
jgi:hypothetical protein